MEFKHIDQEWKRLIFEARSIGLTPEEIINYLKNPTKMEDKQQSKE